MTLSWWERTDRREQLRAARNIYPAGGLLVYRGADIDGRGESARLLAESYEDLGGECFCVAGGYDADPVRSALLGAWQALLPPPDSSVLPAPVLAGGALSLPQIVSTIAALLGQRGEPTVFIFEDLDLAVPVMRPGHSALRLLAALDRCTVIVTSRTESDTDWSKLGEPVIALDSFDESDVRDALAASPDLRHLGGRELDEILETVLEGYSDRRVPARTAYSRLKGAADVIAGP